MKKTLSSLLFIAIFASFAYCAEVEFPKYSGNVNDLAGVIDPENAAKLNIIANKLREHTGAELAVVTVNSTYPLDPKTYATQLFEKWGIGKKERDNGLLVLFIKKEKRIEVEVGYGLEGIITDGFAGAILDKYALPAFKNKNYGRGLYLASLAFYDRITKEYTSRPQSKLEQINLNLYSVLLAVSVIILVGVLALLGRTLIGALISGVAGAFIGYFVAGAAGVLFGFIIGIMISTGGYYGGFGGWGGGGFGGFGGGRSGGGGAGRSF
ncbi:MAG: TPM domain-containing protein [bacterium]